MRFITGNEDQPLIGNDRTEIILGSVMICDWLAVRNSLVSRPPPFPALCGWRDLENHVLFVVFVCEAIRKGLIVWSPFLCLFAIVVGYEAERCPKNSCTDNNDDNFEVFDNSTDVRGC